MASLTETVSIQQYNEKTTTKDWKKMARILQLLRYGTCECSSWKQFICGSVCFVLTQCYNILIDKLYMALIIVEYIVVKHLETAITIRSSCGNTLFHGILKQIIWRSCEWSSKCMDMLKQWQPLWFRCG